MLRAIGLTLILAASLALVGCGDDDNGGTQPSNVAPDAVNDLSQSAAGDSSITVSWTAPDDASKRATVAEYDLRYSASAITTDNFDSAIAVTGEPVPSESDSVLSVTTGGLDFGATYYFALHSADDEGDWSDLSNVVMAATDSLDDRLLAYYPLIAHGADVTGQTDSMFLRNTPFQDGGIYCNGIYPDGIDPNPCDARTPVLEDLDMSDFTIRCKFKVDDYASPPYNPVVVGGVLYRWLGCNLNADKTISLSYNNGGEVTSQTTYSTGTWHELSITYDGTTAKLYLDNTLAVESDITIDHGDARQVTISHGGTGHTFEGVFSHLKVYSEVVEP